MSKETLNKFQRLALFCIIIFLPLNGIPKRFSVPGLGSDLSAYFIVAGMLLLIYEYFKYKFEIPRQAKVFIAVYMVWQLICLAHGLYFYEYNELLILEQIPKLQAIIGKLRAYDAAINELAAIKLWLFFRFAKNILLLNNAVFLVAFYVWHLYKDDFTKGFKDVRNACIVLFILLGIYSVIELLWLKTGLKSAEEILKFINPYLYDVSTTNGWWPPLLWQGQLRSLSREPSFFGIIGVFALPVLWSLVYEKNYKILSAFIIFYYSLMIAASSARTGIITLCGEMFLLFLAYLFIRSWEYLKKVLIIFFITFLGFGVNLIDFNSYKVDINAENYYEENIASVASTDARSNNARLANLLGNLKTIYEYPVFGVGTGLSDAYVDKNLPDFAYSNYEVCNWSKDMYNKGVLKSGYPALNTYADVAVQNGIVGLILYLSVVLYIFFVVIKYRKIYFADYKCIYLIISMCGLLAVQFSNAGFNSINGIVWGLLCCKMGEIKNKEIVNDAKSN